MKLTTDEIENLIGEPIKSFKVDNGSNVDDHHCSDLLKIMIETKSERTVSLVYKKFPSTDLEIKKYAVSAQLFRRENYFYRVFSPRVASQVKSHLKKNISKPKLEELCAHLQLPIPAYIAGFNDDANDFICLEDLRPLGFKMADKSLGLSFLECSLAMKKLAQFHALSFFYLQSEGEDVFHRNKNFQVYLTKQWAVPNETDTDFGKAEQRQRQDLLTCIYRNSIELIKKHCTAGNKEDLVCRMTGQDDSVIKSAYSNIISTTLKTDSKYFPLIIHGDLWINNMLFSYNQKGEPTDVKFIDFQFARRGNIYEDLNFLLFTSTTARFRKEHLNTSLNTYYDAFMSTLKLLNFSPPFQFTREWFMEHFNENILPSYLILSYLIPMHLGKGSEDGSRAATFTDELIRKMERSPLALRRWEEVTREAVCMNIV